MLVNTLFKISEKHNKHYCFPSQNTLQKLLQRHYGIAKSIRTLNRWLNDIEDKKIIKRVRRIKKSQDHGIEFRSTMYFLTIKGLKILNHFGFDVWSRLSKIYDKSIRLAKLAKAARAKTFTRIATFAEIKKIRKENFNVLAYKKSPA